MQEEEFDVTEDIIEFMEEMSEDRSLLLKQRCEKAVEALGPEAAEEEVVDCCIQEIKLMYISDVLRELQEDGLVEVSGVNPSGELIYKATETD